MIWIPLLLIISFISVFLALATEYLIRKYGSSDSWYPKAAPLGTPPTISMFFWGLGFPAVLISYGVKIILEKIEEWK